MNRQKATEENEYQAVTAVRSAVANGWPFESTIVLLLDVEDPTGGAIAKGLKPSQYAEALRKKQPTQTAFLTTYIRRDDLERMSRAMFPHFADAIASARRPPPGSFSILCFSDDGAEFFSCELPESGRAGDA